ncbi:TrmH family RNA methyltransferase [Blattabacterium cuenoti]|uniref:TrmH family RNA methyltransferase n=1 Tax=Blattabacterium cuenoti TaxID=1653831 RepID=UPI00163CD901|nr:TrmH family RNA methyltransferase [Blattabacterium cuenoti]
MKKIESMQNAKIKDLKKNLKKRNKYFIVEGLREFKFAINNKFFPIRIFICNDVFHKYNNYIIESYRDITYYINMKIFKKLAYRENSGGIIALFKDKPLYDLYEVELTDKNSLILILDGIEKPGNLGAMLRTANALGLKIIILSNMKTYIFNPNVIRCSLGCIFNRNVFYIKNIKSVIHWLKENNINIIVTGFHKKSYNLFKYKFPYSRIAVIFGSEKNGVSNIWFKIANKILKIPMFGNIDSLNVSNAMSIILYEIIRQKNYN